MYFQYFITNQNIFRTPVAWIVAYRPVFGIMKLRNCEHPVRVVRHGIVEYVPCGKCDICRTNKNIGWSKRMILESQLHKYCIFGTLTYADMFLPKMYPVENGFVCKSFGDYEVERSDSGLYIYMPYQSEKDKKFIDLQMSERGYIPYLSKYDAQCFFKRVRRYIDYHFCKNLSPNEKQNFEISYGICGEYGPSCYRPHMHFVLWFDAPQLSKSIKQILRACWPYGSSSFRWSSDDQSCTYVAQYVNSVHRLPNCFKVREICPFLLVSKKHPLGYRKIDEKEIQRVLRTASPTANIYDAKFGRCVEIPLWKSVENRLFPKFSGFNFLSDRLRSRLLGLALTSQSLDEFIGCAESFRDNCFMFKRDIDIQVGDYFSVTFKDAAARSNDFLGINNTIPMLKRVFSSVCSSIYYAANRMRNNMFKYGCANSIDDYLQLIHRYEYNKFRFNMKNQYEFFEDLRDNELINFVDMSTTCPVSNPYYAEQLRQVKQTIEHSHKNKRKNEYLAKHPEYMVRRKYDEFLEGQI